MIESLAKTILILFMGAFAGVERYAAFQFSILRPFPSSVILSIVFPGKATELIFMGIFFEVMWLSKIPVGNAVPPHEGLAFYSGVIIYLIFNHLGSPPVIALTWAIFIGISNGIIGKRIDMVQREINLRIARWVESNLNNDVILERSLYYSILINLTIHLLFLIVLLVAAFPFYYIAEKLIINPETGQLFITAIPFLLLSSFYFAVKNSKHQNIYIGTYALTLIILLFYHWIKWIG